MGWLEGLFHGIQATLVAQQVAARAQLDEMRHRSLPQGQPPDSAARARTSEPDAGDLGGSAPSPGAAGALLSSE